MSDEYDVVCDNSSTATSTASSFENVSASLASDSFSVAATRGTEESADESTSDVEREDEELTERPEPSEQDQFYTAAHARNAIKNLIRFTAAMFVVPLLTMFTTYHYIFRDYFHLPPDQAMLYAGMCGVAVVFIIIIVFIYVAYNEEKEDEKIKLASKKSE